MPEQIKGFFKLDLKMCITISTIMCSLTAYIINHDNSNSNAINITQASYITLEKRIDKVEDAYSEIQSTIESIKVESAKTTSSMDSIRIDTNRNYKNILELDKKLDILIAK